MRLWFHSTSQGKAANFPSLVVFTTTLTVFG